MIGDALFYVAMTLGAFYALWILYVFVMNIVRARDAGTLSRIAYYLALPLYVVGIALDVMLNWSLMTLMLVEWPQESTITARLRRHFRSGYGWRYRVAVWFGDVLLNPFDPTGAHIK